jgi:peptidoglycan/xylan/chitin deacetylase (PgdA/CDA1 family)
MPLSGATNWSAASASLQRPVGIAAVGAGIPQLRALVAAGDEIGNHSLSHRDLAPMPPEELIAEVQGASVIIADDTGVWPRSFAYPVGLRNQSVMAELAVCPGLEVAVSQGGSKGEAWPNRWELPRIRVGPGTYPADMVARAVWCQG